VSIGRRLQDPLAELVKIDPQHVGVGLYQHDVSVKHLRESLDAVKARGIPVVVIEGDAGEDVPRIGLDNREAQRQAASHLKALGHEDVAIVALPIRAGWKPGWIAADEAITVDVTRERLAGAREVFPDAAA
jgi:DNA-binding LacI/PurR family transcriptional regulator